MFKWFKGGAICTLVNKKKLLPKINNLGHNLGHGFKNLPRHPNGQFAAKKDIPLHLRDKAVFERLVNEEHKMKFKTKEALDCAYEVKRNGI